MVEPLSHAIDFAHKLIACGARYHTLENALAESRTNISPTLQQTIKILFGPENLENYYFAIIQPQQQFFYPSH